VGPHGHVSVDVDPEVAGRRNWLHVSGANADRTRRDLMLSTRGSAPENFSLRVVQLQSIARHPSRNLIETDGHCRLYINFSINLSKMLNKDIGR